MARSVYLYKKILRFLKNLLIKVDLEKILKDLITDVVMTVPTIGIVMINLGMKSQVMIPQREKESLSRMTSKKEFNYFRLDVKLIGLVDSVVT